MIKHEYKINSISRKLDKFYELDFTGFIKELEKFSDKKISREDKLEWINIFEKNKREVAEILDKIRKTDEEIDQEVYKLYEINA